MKMVKSLLLGTAAGLVAMSGAQAADLPVKAKPVQYVKICSLYGAGFYYIPGTDMCLKIGGYARAEYGYGLNGSSTTSFNGDVNNRGTNNVWWRQRGYITADARNQTEYGTVRSYLAVGLSTNDTGNGSFNSGNQFDANRAFVQFAGFTFGRTASFFDFASPSANSYMGITQSSDTGDAGQNLLAYTAQFGNGLSASISAETRRMTQIVNQNTAALAAGSAGGILGGGSFSATGSTSTSFGAYGGNQMPDIVANLRVDQAWGNAQIMGAIHEVNGTYYSATLEPSGHPSDKYGFALGAGIKLNAPMIGAGDFFQVQVAYAEGAMRYLDQNPGSGNMYFQRGQSAAFGIRSDAVYGGTIAGGTASSVELTKGWNIYAGYEHFWSKSWQTSVYGSYTAYRYNDRGNAMLCSTLGLGAGAGTAAVATAGCNMNSSLGLIGTRTQFNVDADTYLGLDIAYARMNSASTPTGLVPALVIPASTGTTGQVVGSQDNWAARFRVHRNFYP
jgi:hypothetical protein